MKLRVGGDFMELLYKKTKGSNKKISKLIGGVTFTFLIAFIAFLLAKLPGFDHIGQLGIGIIIAVLYRQFFGYPEVIRSGIGFSSTKLLRLAIILYGLKLNIHTVLSDGLTLLARDAIVITFSILFMMWLAKRIKADKNISLLLGIGTGVCGAAAIAAIAPIIKSKDDDTAISVGMVALVGTIFAIGYTLIQPLLPLSNIDYGIWSGMSLHELAHVALAAASGGEDGLAFGLLAKLGRVFLLIPLSFLFMYIMKRKNSGVDNNEAKVQFPFFLLGFIIMSILHTYVLGKMISVPQGVMDSIPTLTIWCLSAAMIGLGLNVNLRDLKKALKPLIAMGITSICLSILTYLIV